MLPTFPEFKKIEITDQQDIEAFTKDYPTYSNFSFSALFCWDVDEKRQISILNENLVARSTCDVTGKEFLSFLGTNKVPETINELFKYAKKAGLKQELRMIPQEATNFCSDPTLLVEIKDDRDNFDYVCSLKSLSLLQGGKYANLRNETNRFMRTYTGRYKIVFSDLNQDSFRSDVMQIWHEWKGLKESYSEREEKALHRLLDHCAYFKLVNTVVFVDGNPVAFSINQILDKENTISHFAKANYNFKGVLSFMDNETARYLVERGCKYMNFEEDMGFNSLRVAKNKYNPVFFLKKYTIKRGGLFKKLLKVI